ncbi:MAG: ABC transporter permease [Chloroflexota bacterium]|nr:ABC transporter permease [Chloroflexota bacterium]
MATITQTLAPTRSFDAIGSLRRIWLLARMTFREAVRKKMIWAVVFLTALFVAFYGWGVYRFKETWDARAAARSFRFPITFNQAVDLNMAVAVFIIFFLAAVMGIFAAIGTIAGEVDGGTFQAILPKPIRRWEVVLGKWLGYALMLALYVGVTMAVVAAEVGAITGHIPAGTVKTTLIVIVATWWLLSLTVLGSTIFATMANGIVCYMFYAFGLAATIVESMGQLFQVRAMENAGLVLSLVFPSQRIYNYANYIIQPATNFAFGGNGGPSSTPPSGAIVPFAFGYLILLVIAACLVFRKKDL